MRMLSLSVLLLALSGPVVAQRPTAQPLRATSAAVERIMRATVTIEVSSGRESSSGSGFIVTSDGLVATAAHVIEGARSAKIRLQSGETFDVHGVAAVDGNRDFALVRIAGFDLPTGVIGNSDSVSVGQRLLAFGAPLGFEATVSDGLLSAIRLVEGTRLFQISIPVSPGSSGGPVTTEDGRVVGLVISGIRGGGAENLNFALPINYVRGQLALASSAWPTPLADITHADTTATPVPEPISGPGATPPGVVNRSLSVDWRTLAGAELYTESKHEEGVRVQRRIQYLVSKDPSGSPTLERHVAQFIWGTGDLLTGRVGGDFAEDKYRVVVGIAPGSPIQVFGHRRSLDERWESFSYEASLEGTTLMLRSDTATVSTSVPEGTLPQELTGAVVAALPDKVPEVVHVWVVETRELPARVYPVRVEFGRRERAGVPIAKSGGGCYKGAKTERTTLDVVWVTLTHGATREVYPVLASRPHLLVGPDVKCIRLTGG